MPQGRHRSVGKRRRLIRERKQVVSQTPRACSLYPPQSSFSLFLRSSPATVSPYWSLQPHLCFWFFIPCPPRWSFYTTAHLPSLHSQEIYVLLSSTVMVTFILSWLWTFHQTAGTSLVTFRWRERAAFDLLLRGSWRKEESWTPVNSMSYCHSNTVTVRLRSIALLFLHFTSVFPFSVHPKLSSL